MSNPPASTRYVVGTSGWVYPHWKRRFYPARLPQAHWFEFYARHFDTVEINYTFYRLPTADAVAAWRTQAPNGFVYAVKASRYLTHIRRLRNPEEPLERMMDVFGVLHSHQGPVLVQMPASFRRTAENVARVRALFGLLPPTPPFVMEFRHDSWFQDEIYALMEDYGVSPCIVSDPERPSADRTTGKILYVRFHGPRGKRYQGKYPDGELAEWASRIEALAEGRPVYVYFNNDHNAHAVRNAMTLREMLGAPAPGRHDEPANASTSTGQRASAGSKPR